MSGVSTIFFDADPLRGGSLAIPAAGLTTSMMATQVLYNQGIKSLIITLSTNANNGAGNFAARFTILEEFVNINGNKTNLPVGQVDLAGAFSGGMIQASRQHVIFNNVGTGATGSTLNQPANLGGANGNLNDLSGITLAIGNAPNNASAVSTCFFPEKFRILVQNFGTIAALVQNFQIRVIK